MHIPDGFLRTEVWAAFDLISVPTIGYLSHRAKRNGGDMRIPLLGVMGAFVFAAQMINFPVGLGTTGHLLGSTLLAVTVGPVPASLVLAVILGIQALVFQDGGLLAWGANAFNMALCGVAAGYLPYFLFGKGRLRTLAIFLGGTLSVMLGGTLALLMLKASDSPVTPAILKVSISLFFVMGLLEGAITVAVVKAIERLNPGFVQSPSRNLSSIKKLVMGAAVALAVVGVLFASALPDVLEKAAGTMGIAVKPSTFFTPLADYEFSQFSNGYLRKATAGLIGVGLVYAACLLLARGIRRREERLVAPHRN